MENLKKYVLSVDQSTQGTKALIFDSEGRMVNRYDILHKQIIDENGWVEHDLDEIWNNTRTAVLRVMEEGGISPSRIVCMGISNQRETVAAWHKNTGEPVFHGIVWQCPRGEDICNSVRARGHSKVVKERTGLDLSPYFSASKMAWILQNVPKAAALAKEGNLCCGTMDSWLVFKMTKGTEFKTDYSNASRTQLLNLKSLQWDEEICAMFNIPKSCLPEICDSDSIFGMTDMDGVLDEKIPIACVMGDSHGALYGQGCHKPGMAKATYGTGSSVMMNVGNAPVISHNGLASSLAWAAEGRVQYVLEGNINYTGAVITWLQKQLGLVEHADQTEQLAFEANPKDQTYIVPAFTGLGAPYFKSEATALITGMTRMTGKPEIARAALACIAYQIEDVINLMNQELKGSSIISLRVDGGPTKNRFLMQFQSDILGIPVDVPEDEELSGIGVAYMAGIRQGFYHKEKLFSGGKYKQYIPNMGDRERQERNQGWKKAVERTLL